MKISTQTRYAVRMLLELASSDDTDQRLTTKQIALSQGISEKYLESIAAKLKKAGLLNSRKGFGGGYLLARKAENISMAEVLQLMENNYGATHCIKNPKVNCKNYDCCVTFDYLQKIEECIENITSTISIADLCTKQKKRTKETLT